MTLLVAALLGFAVAPARAQTSAAGALALPAPTARRASSSRSIRQRLSHTLQGLRQRLSRTFRSRARGRAADGIKPTEVLVVTTKKPAKNGGKPETTTHVLLLEQQEVGDLSTASLLLASGTRLAPIAGSLTGVGSVVLGVHSGYRFLHARNNSQRAEAAHGIAWSLQGLAALGKLVAPHTPGWQTAAKSLGIAGGAIQVGLGSYRLITGAKRRDKKRMILGGLDVGAGLCWAASACAIATPVTLAGFAGFTLAHIAYEHRDSLRAAARRLFGGEPRRAKGEGASDQSGQ